MHIVCTPSLRNLSSRSTIKDEVIECANNFLQSRLVTTAEFNGAGGVGGGGRRRHDLYFESNITPLLAKVRVQMPFGIPV